MSKTVKKGAKAAEKVAKKVARADQKITHQMAQLREAPPLRVAGFLAEVADQPQLITASIATIGTGLFTRRAELVRGGSRMLAAHLVATGLKILIKHQVDRARPKKALADGEARFEPGHSRDHELNSFPSGHTAGAVAVARAASHEIEGAALPATVATGAIAAAQAPTGSHYLTDVLAGGAIGWAAEALVGAVFDRIEPAIERRLTAPDKHKR
jgi:membrane-associated phospholipid phosphatase